VRIGVNLGPVRLVKDINGQPNIVGDGINVAQRVMGFADPGQILVSRSYYDAVSRLSQEYAGMFHYQGSRTDKHVREHEVYAIGYPGDFTSTQRSLSKQSRHAGATGFNAVLFKVENYWDVFVDTMAKWERIGIETYRNATKRQRAGVIITASAVALLLLVTIIVKLASHPEPKPVQVAAAEKTIKSDKAPAPTVALVAQNKIAEAGAKKTEIEPPKSVPKPKKAASGENNAREVKKNARVRTLAETTGLPAVVSLKIFPWGQVELDNRDQGTSPPLKELQVAQGQHTIRITNTKFPVVIQTITVKSGEKITIKHKFAD
jgi:hypothetical protein